MQKKKVPYYALKARRCLKIVPFNQKSTISYLKNRSRSTVLVTQFLRLRFFPSHTIIPKNMFKYMYSIV